MGKKGFITISVIAILIFGGGIYFSADQAEKPMNKLITPSVIISMKKVNQSAAWAGPKKEELERAPASSSQEIKVARSDFYDKRTMEGLKEVEERLEELGYSADKLKERLQVLIANSPDGHFEAADIFTIIPEEVREEFKVVATGIVDRANYSITKNQTEQQRAIAQLEKSGEMIDPPMEADEAYAELTQDGFDPETQQAYVHPVTGEIMVTDKEEEILNEQED